MVALDKVLISQFQAATPVPPRRKISIERHDDYVLTRPGTKKRARIKHNSEVMAMHCGKDLAWVYGNGQTWPLNYRYMIFCSVCGYITWHADRKPT